MNILRSFTETVVTTPTDTFPISFEYDEKYDAVHVFLDDVAVEDLGYIVSQVNAVTLKIEPAIPSGTVRIERETDIDKMQYIFDAGALFIDQNVDADFRQIVHSQQEVRDGFIKLRGDVLPLVHGLQEALQQAQEASEAAQEAADAAQEAAQLVQSAISNIESIADLLAIPEPFTGRTVHVASYYAGLGKGGGRFSYDATKALLNDGVTVFNGWVRDLSSKTLTTDDAGLLGDGSDLSVTTRLQALANAVQNDFKVSFYGNYSVTTHINFRDVSALKLTGLGTLSADRTNWVFGTTNTRNRGVIQLFNCPYYEVDGNDWGWTIVGALKNNPNATQPWQDGDVCIQAHSSPHGYIHHLHTKETFAWSILAEVSPYTVVRQNKISTCVRQSGVNVVINGGHSCDVSYNRISDANLYAVEWETYTPSYDNTSNYNVITDCYKGIVCTGTGVQSVHSEGNIIKRCKEALNGYPLANSVNVTYTNNTVLQCDDAIVYSGVVNFTASFNTVRFAAGAQFFYFSSYGSILEVLSPTEFLILPNILPFNTSLEFSFSGVTGYFMTAKVTQTDNRWGTGTVEKITFNKAVDNPFENMMFKMSSNNRRGVVAGGANANVLISKNTMLGGGTGFYSNVNNTTGSITERVSSNDFLSFGTTLNITANNTVQSFVNNIVSGSSVIPAAMVANNQFVYKTLKEVDNLIAKTSGGVNPTINFRVVNPVQIIGIEVDFSGFSCTGTIVIRIDGVDSYSVTSANLNTKSGIALVGNVKTLSTGAHNLQIVDTVGDLAYTSYKVRLLSL
ncbi:tail spike protein [Acinetobacter phage vB_Ab-P-7]|nr:tail spike protein [Acinetobacter phage vB_Ab-P-7]